MNLQQVKQDIDNGVMVSKQTWLKVLEAALKLEVDLRDCDSEQIELLNDLAGVGDISEFV